jgi:hypothetical protein
MGNHTVWTWLGLFALVANASHGAGLELGHPVTPATGATVCSAQSVLVALASPAPAEAASVCRYQVILEAVCDTEPTAQHDLSQPFHGTVLAQDLPDFSQWVVPMRDFSDRLSMAYPGPAVLPPSSAPPPPDTLPTTRLGYVLRVPNAPPHLA